jgi:hypothetical protein
MDNKETYLWIARIALIVLMLLYLWQSKRKEQSSIGDIPVSELPDIQLPHGEGDFFDVPMNIVSLEVISGDQYKLHLKARYAGKDVGFFAIVPRAFESDFNDVINKKADLKVVHVQLLSAGAESDAFMAMLYRVYKNKSYLGTLKMKDVNDFDCIALQAQKIDLKLGVAKLKLFGNPHSESEDEYFEHFLNLDIPHGKAEFAEKDSDYRKPLLKSMIIYP